MTTFDIAQQVLSIAGLASEGLCALSFVVSGKVRSLPLVFCYLTYLFVSDSVLILIARTSDIWPVLVITTYIGYLVEAAAVWELACRLLRNSGSGATSLKWRLTALCCVLSALAAYLMTDMQSYSDFGSAEQNFLRVDLAVSILRVLAFIAILVFLRLESSGPNAVTSRVISVFAAYAICAMLEHVLNELAPRLKLPAGTFSVSECVCGYMWVFLLCILIWQVLRPVAASLDSTESCESHNYG